MEILVLVLLAVLLVAGAVAIASLRRPSGPELEPPREQGAAPAAAPPETRTTTPADVAVEGAPVAEPVDAPAAEAPPTSTPPPAQAVVTPEAGPQPPPPVEAPPLPPDQLVPPEAPQTAPPEAAPEAAPEIEPEAEVEAVRPRFRDRLGKARAALAGYIGSIRSRAEIDDSTWDELEEALIGADVGVQTTMALLDDLRARVKEDGIRTPDELLDALKSDMKAKLAGGDRALRYEEGGPNVWLFVGVNGVGKTTTIGKIGRREHAAGRQVVMAAADTFRAAAAEQLETWSQRAQADIVRGAEGSDPGAVVFDAVQRAAARGADLVLADTAGRLHTKINLMEELKKVRRVAERDPGRLTEVLLVIDATTGHNGMVQARQFTDAVGVTGVVLTKLDGTAKGGIAVAIQTELGTPIKLVGLGEGVADLVEFDPDEFVDALFE